MDDDARQPTLTGLIDQLFTARRARKDRANTITTYRIHLAAVYELPRQIDALLLSRADCAPRGELQRRRSAFTELPRGDGTTYR